MEDLLQALDLAMTTSRWLIALDRDGTLVPYADRPEEARVDEGLFELVNELAAQPGFDVVVLSARSSAQLRGDFGRGKLILAGNYGMEVCFPDGKQVIQPQALQAVPYIKMVRDELASRLDLQSGVILEDHGYSLCLHWHQVPQHKRDAVHSAVRNVADDFPAVRFRSLPTSYEMLPDISWDKGEALQFIARDAVPTKEDRFYMYAGDTEADRPAFIWTAENGGVSVRVGGTERLGAQFVLRAPEQLHAVLKHIADHRSQRCAA